MKPNQHVKPIINLENMTVTFEVKDHDPLVLEMGKLHQSIILRAACAGMAQVRIVDAAAVPTTDEDGRLIPESERLEMKYRRMATLVAHYNSGTAEWTTRGDGTGGRLPLVVEALMRVKGVDEERARGMLAKHAEVHKISEKRAMAFFRDNPGKVHDMCEAIRAERERAPKLDAESVDAMLDSME